MDYLAYLENIWYYMPYMLYAFVFLTLVPKSFKRIQNFANADYEANRNKYHRCYGPEVCCHNLEIAAKPKQRKMVTRVYPKRKISTSDEPSIQRQVQPSSIQTQTNVNQIARMFETANKPKKINRVIPTVLPEIRTNNVKEMEACIKFNSEDYNMQENNENCANILNCSELQRNENPTLQRRNVPNSLNLNGLSENSVSTTECSSPAGSSESAVQSPVLRSAAFNLKSSLEDIYAAIARNAEKQEQFIYAGCNALAPVTSIEDILSQRRLSRPLSAYSISDLLNEEQPAGLEEAYVSNYLRTINSS